ncbi:hypothetical protein LAZ67_3004153 [Cordylochernes scorpioides]|uniref:Helix-turn-helix domain-containing protein n=1 Tax=Cordylochernes scorpioides TaxID=51811 RepID=A0ABY6K937_9ARAC|nr:hypothetical protein LAZ67_3004153 [Cordylochernes scorpioides]
MGSSLSTSVAEIVIGRIDSWITSLFPSDIVLWRRYIDEIFCICPENQTKNILERQINSKQLFIISHPSTPTISLFPPTALSAIKINTIKTLTKRIHSHCSLQTFKTEETQNIIRNLKTCQYPLSFILTHFYSPSEIRNSPIYKSIINIPYSPVSCWTRGPVQEGHDVMGLAGPVVGGDGVVAKAGHVKQFRHVTTNMKDSLSKAGALGLPEARESTSKLDERDLLRTIKTQCLQEWKSNAAHDWYRAGWTSTVSLLPRKQRFLISRLKSGIYGQ